MTAARLAGAVPGELGLAWLLEREQELAVFARCVADAGAGRGRLVVVEGPAGIGKTALLGAARRLACERGVLVLSARGGPLEENFSYGVIRQLFEPFAVAGGGLESGDILTGAAALAMRAFAADQPNRRLPPQDVSFSTLHGLYWLTVNLSTRQPLLVVVDDCHWADVSSVRFLAYLGARLDGLPVLVIATIRSGDRAASPGLLGSFLSLANETICPSPLGAAAAARIVRRELGTATDRFCRACHAATGGNPLLLRTLVASFSAEGGEPSDQAAAGITEWGAGSVARLLARRLALLRAGAGEFVRALAILGEGVPLRHVAALAALRFEQAADLADGLRAASVLAPSAELAFAHPILRAAAEETMGSEQRGLAHARAAELLVQERAPPDRVALHLLHVHPRGDAGVVATLRVAASIAAGRGAPETAASYLRRALDEPPPPESRGHVLLELGLAEMAARRHPGAVAQLREAAVIVAPSERPSAALVAGRALGVAGFFQEAAAVLESVADADPRIVAELAANSCQFASRASAALRQLASYADAKLPSRPGWHLMQVMLAHRSLVTGDPCPVVSGLLDPALAGPELFGEASLVAVYAAMDLVFIDRLDDAERLCTAFIEEGRRLGAPSIVTTFPFPRAFSSLRRGVPRDAEADARWSFEDTLAMGTRSGSGPAWPLAFLVDALTDLGDFTGADQALARANALDGGLSEQLAWAFVVEARGRLRVAQGRLREGLGDLREAGGRWERLGCERGPIRWREDAALALVQLGATDEAQPLAAEQLTLARAAGLPRLLGAATRVAGAVAPREQGIPLLREAVELLGQAPARLELARALVELGAALRRDGHRAEARDHLRRGLELAHRAGAAPLAAVAREELLAAGGRPRKPIFTGVEALTASELRIARLAAEGRTNREIAEGLFVTQRTVETHLRHVFQKLGIGGREQLPRKLTSPGHG